MGSNEVAVVTGSNKGIGFAIVRGLCKQFKGDVYLTSRDEDRGKAAVAELEKEGLHPKYHQLDVYDKGSVEKLRKFLSDNYGGLDVLINNAGIAYKNDGTAAFIEQTEATLNTNYWGVLNVYDGLFPLLRPHSRVVHVSSMVTPMALNNCSKELRDQLVSVKTINEMNGFMKKYVDDVKAGTYKANGWPTMEYGSYGVSKIGVTLLAKLHQDLIDQDTTKSDIIVNACCPGYVKTDLNQHKGTKTIEEGADTPLYLALLPKWALDPKGKFLSERKIEPYY